MTSPSASGGFRRLAILIAVTFVDMVGFMIVLPLLPLRSSMPTRARIVLPGSPPARIKLVPAPALM